MLLHGLPKGTEDDPQLLQLLFIGRFYRNAVEHHIHRHPGQRLLLRQRDPQLLEGRQQLRIDLVQTVILLLALRGGVIGNFLKIDHRKLEILPIRKFFPANPPPTPPAATPAATPAPFSSPKYSEWCPH